MASFCPFFQKCKETVSSDSGWNLIVDVLKPSGEKVKMYIA